MDGCKVKNYAATMLHIRVNREIQQQAAMALAELGTSVSDAVRMLLLHLATEKSLPFKMVPNPATVKAMRAVSRGHGKRMNCASALFKELGI